MNLEKFLKSLQALKEKQIEYWKDDKKKFVLFSFIILLLSTILFAVYDNLLFLAFPFVIILICLIFYNPLIGIFPLLLAFFYPPLFNSPGIEIGEICWFALFVLVLIGGFVRALLRKNFFSLYQYREVIYPLLLFDFLIILSSVIAYANNISLIWYMHKFTRFLGYLLPLFILISVEKKERKIWAKILIIFFISIGVLKGFQQIVFFLSRMAEVLIAGTLGVVRKFSYGGFFGLPGSILAIAFYSEAKNWKQKTLFIFLFFFFFLILVASFTRGIWLGFIVSLIALYIFFKSMRKNLLQIYVTLVLILLSILISNSRVIQSVAQRFTSVEKFAYQPTAMERFQEWKSVVKLIPKRPIFGYGIGKDFSYYSIIPGNWGRGAEHWVTVRYSHNLYLYLLLTTGATGLLSFLWLIFAILKSSKKLYNESFDTFSKAYASAFFSIIVGFLITSITSPVFVDNKYSIYIGVLIGALLLLSQRND